MDLPPAHFVKDEMQNRRTIVDGLSAKSVKTPVSEIVSKYSCFTMVQSALNSHHTKLINEHPKTDRSNRLHSQGQVGGA